MAGGGAAFNSLVGSWLALPTIAGRWPEADARQQVLARHDFVMAKPAAAPFDGLLLGNGDLGAAVWAEGETLIFSLGKNDVWDRRLNTSHDRPVATYNELLARVGKGDWNFKDMYHVQPSWLNPFPTPKPVCELRLSGLGPISNLRLRLVDATLEFETQQGRGVVFVEKKRNLLLVRLPAGAAAGLRVEIVRHVDTANEVGRRLDNGGGVPSPENARDPANGPLPPPETGAAGNCLWALQRMPAEATFPGGFAVAAAAALGGAEATLRREDTRVVCRVGATSQSAVTLALGVRTTTDGDRDLVAATRRLAEQSLGERWEGLHAQHAQKWGRFWSRSFVEITATDRTESDLRKQATLAEGLFYRNLYRLACCSRPRATAPGLFGNWIWNDYSAFHGNYTLDYNFEQTFWPAFITNHPELAEPYLDRVSEILPRARRNTHAAFGDQAVGAFFTFNDYPIHHDEALFTCTFYEPWMEISAWVAQHFWRHWQYVGDRKFLEERAYQVLAEVARFYEWFLNRSQREDCSAYVPRDGRLHIFPTISPEHWGITPKFERNRDSASAIGFFRYHLLAAADAAEILERDREEAARWRKAAHQLPEYPTTDTPQGKIFVDVPGAPSIEYNIPVPVVPVFPAEDPLFWSDSERIEVAQRTMSQIRTTGGNSLIMLGVVRARLGMGDSLAQFLADRRRYYEPNGPIGKFLKLGIYPESFAAAGVIAEHLLQSHPDATGKQLLRLFPALPEGMDARFAGLLAEGAFEVTAERRRGRVTKLELTSRRGNHCRILNPWEKEQVGLSAEGRKRGALAGNVLEFPTRVGGTYRLWPSSQRMKVKSLVT